MSVPVVPPPGRPVLATSTAARQAHAARSGRPGRVNAVVVAYLLAAVVVAVSGDAVPAPRWLALHLLLLGAATNAIVIWSAHFAGALLHSRGNGRRGEPWRLATLNAGAVLVLAGVGWELPAYVVAGGAALVGAAVLAHLVALLRLREGSLGGPLAVAVWFYVGSAVSLVVGGALGGLLATETWPALHERLHVAHAHANLLGWVGLTVVGTEFMLWPAVLRTRMVDGAAVVARHVVVMMSAGLTLCVAGLLVDVRPVAVAGLAVYAGGVARSLGPFLRTARQRPPHSAAAWMLAAATAWLVVAVVVDLVVLALSGLEGTLDLFDAGLPVLAVGFVGQVLAAALTFLLPVVLGGGPEGNRRLTAVLDTAWPARTAALNSGALLLALPLGGFADRAAWALVLAGGGSFVVLAASVLLPDRTRRLAWPAALVLIPALVVVAAQSALPRPDGAPTAPPTTGTRTVTVRLTEFAVTPAHISVPRGTRLRLDVRNDGHLTHDLKVDGRRGTHRLRAHQSQTVDVGVIAAPVTAWCTIGAHRQAGMQLRIDVDGGPAAAPAAAAGTGLAWRPDAVPSPDWRPYDARLAPAPGGREHRVTVRVEERDVEVAPGVTRRMWTFGGTVPGPVLRGRVGDLFTVTLVNGGTMAHSIDFHASEVAPDRAMRSIEPGESLTYQFRAARAGVWMYHCGTAPLLQHVANGMYGALIVDPPGLAEVDRELVLVQSELYLDGTLESMRAARPDAVVFNGYADQYRHAPVHVDPGDRVRIWVLDAGPSDGSAFHVVGAQFDTAYKEGSYLLRAGDGTAGGSQALDLAPSQGGFVELSLDEPGTYPFVTHRLADASRGATGLLVVGEPAAAGHMH